MSYLWIWWWSFDDHLSAAIGAPDLGHLPFWVPVLISICASCADSGVASTVKRKLEERE